MKLAQKNVRRFVFSIALGLYTPLTWSPEADAANSCSAIFENPARSVAIRNFDASETLSQMVRDNAPDYWKFSLKNGSNYFAEYIGHSGLVVGDTHPGNFIISPLNGELRFFIADIKDSGSAPYILDFARLVLSTHAVLKGEVKLAETANQMQFAYEAGLSGSKYSTPREAMWIFRENLEDFKKLQAGYVSSKMQGRSFKKKPGILEDIPFAKKDPKRLAQLKRDIRARVKDAFGSTATVLDFAVRPRERGGSADMNRYWALVQSNSKYSIVEFKEVSQPATSQYRAQEDATARYKKIIDTFWQTEDPHYQVVRLDGADYFMRPKKTDIFRVPYKLPTQEDVDFTLALARYDAYYLGQLHGRQNKSTDYSDLVKSKHSELNDSLRKFTKDYIDHLVERIDESDS